MTKKAGRRPFPVRALLLALMLVGSVSAAPALADTVGPTIDVWYGDTQTFALPGTPQPYINILGNVSDVDGVASLSYSLNLGPDVDLTLGTGTSSQADRRLAAAGDFNIDLATSDLDGSATTDSVVITAEDGGGYISQMTVTVDYVAPAGAWAIPSTVTWPAPGGDVNSVAQVVDGQWDLTASGVRTLDPGYDRSIALGDVTWTDYVVSTPITIHTLAGDVGGGVQGGVGYVTGWQGHTDEPASVYENGSCGGPLVMQPKCGFEPKGVTARYRTDGVLELRGDGFAQYDSTPMTLSEGSTYIFKLRVAGVAGEGNAFSMKVWEQGSPEPSSWDVWGQEPPGAGPDNGALVLTSHHDDVTFGDVTIEPLSLTPPVGEQDLAFTPDLGSVEIDVLANDVPGDIAQPLDPTSVTIATDPSNGTVAVNPTTGAVTYTHTATGTTTDSFTYVVDDSTDTPSEPISVTLAIGAPAFESDDFNSPTLDTRWTWIPATAGSYQLVGAGSGDAHLAISVPAGTAHDKWNAGDAPRVMQDASDINFAIEAKYETQPAVAGNVQGIIVEEDAGRWLRFDVQHTGSGLRAFAADTTGSSSVAVLNELIPGPVTHLQVTRTDRRFTFAISSDGEAWTDVGAFRTTIAVNSVGAFASNPNGEAWTSELDFFFHPVAPVDPEDPVATAPATMPDAGVVQFDLGSTDIDVLDNDDAGSFAIDPETVAIVDDPSNGTVDVDPVTGVVTYTHTEFGTSADSFTYTVDDIVGTTSEATTVTISIEVVADEVVLVEPNGRWHIRVPGDDDYTFFYGVPGDVPLFGDWDGDGFDTPGMYRPSNGFAYLTDTLPADGGVGVAEFDFFYGIPGDQVFVGDWDGINGDSLGISRNGKIFLANTNATVVADVEFWFGLPTDIAYGADPDGDGKDTVIVYRESSSFAYYTNDTTMNVAPTDGDLFFGIPGDSFVIGDWDADNVDTPGVFRGSDTTVYLKNDYVTGAADDSYVWGTDGWTPVAGVHGIMAPPA